ncbi:MAG: hypothetical protein H8K10_14800 [Nitrospira sp.]|nr:hypothetical protein [Nitrospira sp.]
MSRKRHEWYLLLSVALALATKGTAYLMLLPFVGYAMISVMKQEGLRAGFRSISLMVLAILLLNTGHWSRNVGLWHHPLVIPTDGGNTKPNLSVFRRPCRMWCGTWPSILEPLLRKSMRLTHEDYAGNGIVFVLSRMAVGLSE